MDLYKIHSFDTVPKQAIRVIRVNVWNVLASTAQIYIYMICIKAKNSWQMA